MSKMIRPQTYYTTLAMLQKLTRGRLWLSVNNHWQAVHNKPSGSRAYSINLLCSSSKRKDVCLQTGIRRAVNWNPGCSRYMSAKSPTHCAEAESQTNLETKKISRADQMNQVVDDLFHLPKPTEDNWIEVGEKFSKCIPNAKQWPSVVMKMIAGRMKHFPERSDQSMSLATSLLAFARQRELESPNQKSARVSVALLVSCMNICGHYLMVSETQDKKVEAFLVDLYSEVQIKAPLMDMDSSSAVIEALCSTKGLWRQSLDVFTTIKEVFPPASGQVVPIIAAAYRYDCPEVAEDLFDDLGRILRGQDYSFTRTVDDRIVCAVLDKARRDRDSEQVTKLLTTMHQHHWFLTKDSAGQLIQYFESIPGEEWSGRISSVTRQGVCRNCREQLASEGLTEEQFEQLRDGFLQKCVRREDVFLNTSPKELETFQKFLKSQQPFDVVLDGLNISLQLSKRNRHQRPAKLLKVVQDLSRRGRLLILGRKHMQRWSATHMAKIEELATIFYAEDISSDDPFMLYAALHSGPETLIVTDDMLRNHRILLPPHLRDHFNVWQRTHQVTFSTEGSPPRYSWPSRHDTRAQWTQSGCHVPFDDQSERASHELPNSWVCLQRGQQAKDPG